MKNKIIFFMAWALQVIGTRTQSRRLYGFRRIKRGFVGAWNNMKNRYPIFAAMLGLAIGHLPGVASAAVSWTFDSANCVSTSPGGNCGTGANNFANTRTYAGSGGAGNVTVSGWSNTIGGDQQLEQGDITHYGGGLGVRNADYDRGSPPQDPGENFSPEHAVDNDDRFDLVLFDFGTQSVDLSQVAIGWYQQDSDLTVLAYTGNSDPTDSNSADYIGDREAWWNSAADNNEDLTSNGWTLIGNHDVDDGPAPTNSQNINVGGIDSSYWIVAAYNEAFGSSCSPAGICQSSYADFFKISAVTGDIMDPPPGQGVPVPATLALIALGLAGIGYKQRGKKKAA